MSEVIRKLAIPMVAEKFSAHYGQTTSFQVFELDPEQKKVVGQTVLALPNTHACGMAGWLREQGVEAVVVGNLGQGAFGHLLAANLAVYAARTANTPEGLVQAFLDGLLPNAQANCTHHESEHHGHQHQPEHGKGHGHGQGQEGHTCQCQAGKE